MDIHNAVMDIYNSITYIHNCIYGNPYLHIEIIGFSTMFTFNAIMDIHEWIRDIHNWIMDVHN